MPTLPRPCRRAGARTTALAALTLAGSTAFGVPAAVAQPPVDNGDIKIHKMGTTFSDQSDESQVCDFYLAAFDFAANEQIHWEIDKQPVPGPRPELAGDITAAGNGAAQSVPLGLPNGQYKLTWSTNLGHGAGKFKVFEVDCATPKPRASSPGPHGGPPAGGGGLARDAAFAPVAGAAAVGLAAVSGVVWFRLRRRPHGSH
ncbi:hypothetical protein [Streptomyces broussonetiae]|uniref:Copper resistance protein CopC n=1 Tax=Streptomyces broussonetiae TaxID=2686304 RepID=A0ABV5E6Y7_9ACTN